MDQSGESTTTTIATNQMELNIQNVCEVTGLDLTVAPRRRSRSPSEEGSQDHFQRVSFQEQDTRSGTDVQYFSDPDSKIAPETETESDEDDCALLHAKLDDMTVILRDMSDRLSALQLRLDHVLGPAPLATFAPAGWLSPIAETPETVHDTASG